MKNNSLTGQRTTKGFALVYILVAVVLIGGATYALVPRSVLKEYFGTGDKPTEAQFGDTIDSSLNMQDDKDLLGLKEYDTTKKYEAGDSAVATQPVYQAKVLTEAQKEFKLDAEQSVTFRWAVPTPKPQGLVTYRLKVWQLMQGQNGSQAMKTNQPVVTKDVDTVTEVTVAGLYTGPCKPPYLCDFIWSVEAISKSDSGSSASGTIETTTPGDSTNGDSTGGTR